MAPNGLRVGSTRLLGRPIRVHRQGERKEKLTRPSGGVWSHTKDLLKSGAPISVHEIHQFDQWAMTFVQLQADNIEAHLEFRNHDRPIIRVMGGGHALTPQSGGIGQVLGEERGIETAP